MPGQHPDHHIVPPGIVRFTDRIDTLFKDLCHQRVFRAEVPRKHNPAGTLTVPVHDQHPPATIVAADIRPGEMNRAECLFRTRLVPEERAGLGKLRKDALVIVECVLVRVHGHNIRLVCVPVEDHELVIPVVFGDTVDKPEVAATLATLLAVKGQPVIPPVKMDGRSHRIRVSLRQWPVNATSTGQ